MIVCPYCKRETYASIPDGASDARTNASCPRSLSMDAANIMRCDSVARGRQLAFKEALAILKRHSDGEVADHRNIARELRAAMKVPKA